MRISAILLTTFLLIGCGGGDSSTASSTPYNPTNNMKNLMNWVIEPMADVIWLNSGWEITEEGERELFPRNDQEWEALVHAAAGLAESGNLLMIPGREGSPEWAADWYAYSEAMIESGNQLREAAEAQDKQAIFDLGGQLYQVCVACHTRYALSVTR